MKIGKFSIWMGSILSLLFMPAWVSAATTILNHNTDDTSVTYAVCLATPDVETDNIVVDSIRITTSKSTNTTYTFSYKRTSDSIFDTSSLSGAGCVAPACANVLSVEGVKSGHLIELKNLDLVLPRGARLYMNTDADIGAAYQTIEVVYKQ